MAGNRYDESQSYGFKREDLDDNWGDEKSPYDLLVQAQQNSMNRQLESTRQCMASLDESERLGIATAEELSHQGEQLNNIEYRVDKINQDTKVAQSHLNNIKSVFGGIKNWWSGKKVQEVAQPPPSKGRQWQDSMPPSTSSQSLGAGAAAAHPALAVRGLDKTDGSASRKTQPTTEFEKYESQLDAELDVLSNGLARLKGLGTHLGQEIEEQNQQIDRINKKADRADITIRDQNRQMKQILK